MEPFRFSGALPMLIFYAWAVFLAAIILSVPIVYWIEQSRRKQAQGEAEPEEDDAADIADEDLPGEAADQEMPEDLSEFGAPTPVGEDDFSAFEEEFK